MSGCAFSHEAADLLENVTRHAHNFGAIGDRCREGRSHDSQNLAAAPLDTPKTRSTFGGSSKLAAHGTVPNPLATGEIHPKVSDVLHKDMAQIPETGSHLLPNIGGRKGNLAFAKRHGQLNLGQAFHRQFGGGGVMRDVEDFPQGFVELSAVAQDWQPPAAFT